MGDGANLKKVLDIQGRNIRELSKKTGVTASTLYTIVKRDAGIKVGVAMKLAEELNISPVVICEDFPPELEEAMKKIKKTVIRRPITVGDEVFLFTVEDNKDKPSVYYITKTTVTDISLNHGFTLSCYSNQDEEVLYHHKWDSIGEEVFLSREEAMDHLEAHYEFPYKISYSEE